MGDTTNYRLWDTKEYILKDYFDILKGKGISKNDVDAYGKYECIRYGELYTKYGNVISDVYSKTNVTESIKSVKGDLILPSSGETAEDMASISAVSKDGILLGGDINILRPKVDEFDYRYLSYNLNTSLRKEISTLAQGISVMHIYPSSLEKLKLNIHEYDLQTKIGKLILDIDDSIKLFKEQKELLEQKKKHYLNVIFNDKNGDNIAVKLSDILYVPEKQVNENLDMNKILRVGLHLKGVSSIGNDNTLSNNATKYYIRRKNDLIYGKQNIFNGSIAIIPDEFDQYSSSGDVPVLRFKEKYNIHEYRLYIYYLLSRKSFYNKLEVYSNGTGSKRLHEDEFLKQKVNINKNIEYCILSSNLLYNIDNEVSLLEGLLNSYKERKRYYLNKLFS